MNGFGLLRLDEPAQFFDVPKPTLGDDEVLIRVHATSVNPVDQLMGLGFFRAAQGEDEGHQKFARLCHALLRKGGRASSMTNGGVPELLGDIPYVNVHSTPTPSRSPASPALSRRGP